MKHDDPDFLDKVSQKSEASQCLCHAHIYDCSKTLLLIGNQNGTITKGIWIEFPIDIRKVHLCTLKVCYSLSLKWVHEQ